MNFESSESDVFKRKSLKLKLIYHFKIRQNSNNLRNYLGNECSHWLCHIFIEYMEILYMNSKIV